jgi:hypothetical protein
MPEERPPTPTFLYAHPNRGGGLRVVSNIVVDHLPTYADPSQMAWARTAEVGHFMHDGRTLIVRTD